MIPGNTLFNYIILHSSENLEGCLSKPLWSLGKHFAIVYEKQQFLFQ